MGWRRHRIEIEIPQPSDTIRKISRFPFVPDSERALREHSQEVLSIQVSGLVQRLRSMKEPKVLVGVSGGLDSTLALLVAKRAMDRLSRDTSEIVAVTMPGYGTSEHTRSNALALMSALGVTGKEIDIRPASEMMLRDMDPPVSWGLEVFDVAFENVQAGARTSLLFRLANQINGLVVGTGDLSEFALGWCTYGVGDQMPHYVVNASLPKTLVKHIIHSQALDPHCSTQLRTVLLSVLDTPISPELLPLRGDDSGVFQMGEDILGPFELQDFFLYYTIRFGFDSSKLLFLAEHAWSGEKTRSELRGWLDVFTRRFFGQSQFKRSAMPNGPKVGTGGNLSPTRRLARPFRRCR